LRFGNSEIYMSRIGKKPIEIPEKTEVQVTDKVITVKGPLGSLEQVTHPSVKVEVKDKEILVSSSVDTIEARALWGTYASIIGNMIQGVHTPFEKKLSVEGVGFKVDMKGRDLLFALGFSHPVEVVVPEDLTVTTEKNVITVSGISKHAVGQFAANIRKLKKPEPYKGKGIRYTDEVVRRKEGKKSV